MARLEERAETYFTTARGMCRRCRTVQPARVFFRDGQVWQQSLCPCGPQEPALVAADSQWYLAEAVRGVEDRSPLVGAHPPRRGCPHDCGPCTWHASPCQLPVLSITNACNLRCPVCFTYNRDDRIYHMPVEEMERTVQWILDASQRVDLINLTGGEPTLHPDLLALLRTCRRPEIGRITMNSNGIRLAEDEDLCRRLAELDVCVVLSLNTFDPQTSIRLHGRDLTAIKRQAIDNLARAGVRMTLLNVLIRDVNENALAGLLDLMRQYEHILSLTVQTMTYTGQGGGQFPRTRHIPVDEAAQTVARQSQGALELGDFVTRPSAHPLCYLVCYLLKSGERMLPFARFAPRDEVRRLLANSYLLRPGPAEEFFTEAINQLYATGETEHLGELRRLIEQLYPSGHAIDDFQRQRLAESSVRTVYLHAHMDEDTFDCSRAMLCPDLVPAEPGRWIPACTYNLFYRMQDERFYIGEQMPESPSPRPSPPSCCRQSPAVWQAIGRQHDGGEGETSRSRAPMDCAPTASPSPPLALGITHSVCETCRALIPAKVIADGGDVFFEKFCPEHGGSRSRVRADADDYLRTLRYVKPAWIPREFATAGDAACPEGCGMCPRHEQHLCMPIVEITSRCDLACPACLTAGRISDPAGPWDLSPAELSRMLDQLIAAERQVDVLNFSGGEPLVHPSLLDLVDEALRRPEIVRVSLSTNGLAFLDRPELIDRLRERNVVVSLQLDGFRDEAYRTLRGRPLVAEKRRVLELLEQAGISTSLTMTVAGGVNEDQLSAVLDYFFAQPHVVSLMLQPLAFAGRGEHLRGRATRLSIPDVVRLLAASGRAEIQGEDFQPLPCSHPLCFSLAYYLALDGGGFVSLGRMVEASRWLDTLANRTVFGLDEAEHERMKDMVYDLWSGPAGAAPDSESVMRTLRGLLDEMAKQRFDPRQAFRITERRVKSIFIHAFQDAETFDLARVRRCCNAYPQPDGTLRPACVYNVLGRRPQCE